MGEMKKAMKMSMTEDENADTSNNKQSEDGSGDVDMSDATNPNKSDVREQLKDAGLNDDELDLLEQIKKAKGITVSLKMDDFVGLTKEQNLVKQKLDKERRRRDGIKAAQEAERKRKAYELKMVAGRKKREKAEAARRKKAIQKKIA